MRTMMDLDEAFCLLERELAAAVTEMDSETVALQDAQQRSLAEDLFCTMDHPPFTQSAMDGIAFAWQPDVLQFKLIGTYAAGAHPSDVSLAPGECVRIMTGAPLPQGADTVEMVEKVRTEKGICYLESLPPAGQHVRQQGENRKQGAPLALRGDKLTPARCAALASQGLSWVKVKKRIKLGLVTTGDEVVPIHQNLEPGQIYNSNAPALAAGLAAPDISLLQLGTLPDRLEATTAFLERQTCLDVLVLTGGVSMGEFDFVPKAAIAAGFTPVFHKVKMKPGKPIWFGKHPKGTLLFGLPGNPVSALVGAALFVRPAIDALRQGVFQHPHWASLPLASDVKNHSHFPLFHGAVWTHWQNRSAVLPIETSGSGDVVRFGAAQTLIRVPPDSHLEQGTPVEVLLSSTGVIG